MAKSGTQKKEIEISNCDCKSYCSSDIYAKKENDEYTFTDIRTLVNFEKYKKSILTHLILLRKILIQLKDPTDINQQNFLIPIIIKIQERTITLKLWKICI